MNPTLRGFLVIALIAAVIVVLQLESTLTALFLIAQIAFFLAIAFFVYLVWRERRGRDLDVVEPRACGLLRLGAADRRRTSPRVSSSRSGTAGP